MLIFPAIFLFNPKANFNHTSLVYHFIIVYIPYCITTVLVQLFNVVMLQNVFRLTSKYCKILSLLSTSCRSPMQHRSLILLLFTSLSSELERTLLHLKKTCLADYFPCKLVINGKVPRTLDKNVLITVQLQYV